MRDLRWVGALGVVVAVLAGCGSDNGPNSPGTAVTLVVNPPDTTIAVAQGAPYVVVALDESGDTVAAPEVTWSSSDTGVAAIDSTGVATGRTPGNTTIVATAGAISSQPAVLHVAASAGPCYGIGTATKFVGTMAWGFKAVDQQTDGGFLVSADDQGSLSAVMTQMSAGPITAAWWGEVIGTASVTQKKDDGSNVQTYNSTAGTIIPQPVIGMPKLTLLVDLQQCTYRVVSGASVATILKDPFGNLINSVDIVAAIQFAGQVPADWRTAGIGKPNGTMGGHSVIWLGANLDKDGLAPLGFAVELFEQSPTEPPAGEASGGFSLTYQP